MDARNRLLAVERLVAAGATPSPAASRSGEPRALAERFVEFAHANSISLEAMWAWLDGSGRVRATALAVPNPGRTALFFGSRPNDKVEPELLAATIARACADIRATMDLHLAQVLLEPREGAQRRCFEAGGFSRLADLSYMERPLPGRATAPPRWPADTTVEPYTKEKRDELLAVLDASYEETLDCPGLGGLRRTEDILAGHAGTGEFEPSLWTLLRVDGRAAGALLLNPSTASGSIELVYIGLERGVRGRGLGRQLLRHGLCNVRERSERTISLAVDECNEPAIALYLNEGFRRVLRRTALICPLV